ncbi:restriction endonuclease subunit S [Vibrio misgurnus]|uniref:restriction endonuclease subunit S n=1 Tax=Vibrio misgurnus TaxID=2993714 RepID=UPI002415DD5C|nr:restriction endonuclease subunit S [Vibrio sp. gvc]
MSKYQAYPEYKNSGIEWLGEIPSHWKTCRLKHLASIKNGQDYKVVQSEVGYPVMGSGGQFAFATEFMYDKPSVLLGRKGTIDKPLYINEPFWTVDTMYYTEMQPETDAKYLYYLATTIQFARYSTNTALPSMTQEHLGNYTFAVPVEVSDRTQIANFLDHETAKIDALIEKQQQLISLLQEKRQAVISHAVTKGLNPDVPMKDSGVEWLGQVPEHWVCGRLKNTLRIKNGKDYKDVEVEDGGYPVYGSGGIFKRCSAYLFDGKSILFGRKGTVDKPLLVEGKFWTVDTMFYSELEASCRAEFIFFQSLLFPFSLLSTNTALPSMTQEDLLGLGFVIPPLTEQDSIIEHITFKKNQFDGLVFKAERAVRLLKERRTALISAAVTGKIDVRNWQTPGQSPSTSTEEQAL